MKKRVLAVILTLAMTASLAAGCGSGEESGSDEDTITLSFLDKHPEEEYKGYFEQAIADFEEQNPGVEIEYENISDQAIKEKLSVLAAGGDLPDIFFAQGKDSVRIGRKIHRRINHPLKLRDIHHNVVAGGHHHIGLRITCLYFPTDVCYTRSRIATARLTQDMIISNIGQLLLYSVRILL